MEDLLLERGGLCSVRRILDRFFDPPIIRTEGLKERKEGLLHWNDGDTWAAH